MFRWGWKIVLLLLLGLFIFVWVMKAPMLSRFLTDKLGIKVSLQAIHIWPKSTHMQKFRLKNPRGYQHKTALEVQDVWVYYHFQKIRSNPVEIDEIVLDDVYLNIELPTIKTSQNNWAAIGASIPEMKAGKPVIIHKLVVKNLTVETLGAGAKILGVQGKKHFDSMEFYEIDSRVGFPTKELISKIFDRAGIIQYLKNFLNPVEDLIKQNLPKPFQIFGKRDQSPPKRAL